MTAALSHFEKSGRNSLVTVMLVPVFVGWVKLQIHAQHARPSPINCHDVLYCSFAADSNVIAG